MAEISLIIGKKMDITLEESGSASFSVNVRDDAGDDFDLSGYQIDLIAKIARLEELPDLFNLSSAGSDPNILLSLGNFTITFPSTSNKSGRYIYDLWATKDGQRKTWLSGKLIIQPKAYILE